MAEAQDYIDPIIKAMIATRQAQQESQNLAEKTRASKQEEAFRTHQLEQQETQFQREHDLRVQAAELARKHFELQSEVERLGNVLKLGHGVQEGDIKPFSNGTTGQVPTLLNQGQQQPQSLNIPGIGPISFGTPEEAGARKIQEAAQIAAAQRKAQEGMIQFQNQLPPSQTEQLHARTQKDIADEATARAITTTGMNVTGRAEGKQSDFDRAMGVALLRMNAANNGSSVDEGTAQQYLDGLFVNGKMKLSQIPQKQRQAVLDAGKKIGYTTVLDPKDNEQIDGIPLMQDFIAKAKRLAEIGSGFSGKTGVITGGLMGNEAAGNLKQQVDGMLGNIARIYGGEKGVLTQRDIERGVGLVYSAKLSKEENLKKVEALERAFKEKLSPVLSNYPEGQRQAILEQRGINWSSQAAPVKQNYQHIRANAAGHQIGSNDGVNWFDVQTGAKIQ